MNELNEKYIGKDVDFVREALIKDGYNVSILRLEPKKDIELLTDEIVVKVSSEQKNATITTSMFKKYV